MASFNGPKLTNPIRTDVPDTQEVLVALAKQDPTPVSDIPSGAKRLYEASSGKWQWQEYNGSSWAAVPFLQHNVDQLDGYHAAITPAANTVAVRNASGVLEDSITGNAATASSAATLSQTLPVNKGGTGATTSEAARANLGVPPASHASANTTHGVGNATQYGHLKLSDATDSLSGVTGGIAATPAAVKAAKDAADAAQSSANNAQSSADAAMEKASTPATANKLGPVKVGDGLSIGDDGSLSAVTVPVGGIIAFSGTFGGNGNRFPIPLGGTSPDTNWCLCDGVITNGRSVPDLRGRMILGASDAHPAGSTGGSATHTHSISGTVGATTLSVAQMPSHKHGDVDILETTPGKASYVYGGGQDHNPMEKTGGSQPHTHTLDGATGSANSLPPYYALAYIMRCA